MSEQKTDWTMVLIPPFGLAVLAYGLFVESLLLAIVAILLAWILKVLSRIEASVSSE